MSSSKTEKSILFSLVDDNDVDYLKVDFSALGDSNPVLVNLNDETTCQEELRKLFVKIMGYMIDIPIDIEFVEDDKYPREFIHSAMSSYVSDLKAEIQVVQSSMQKELGGKTEE